MINKHSIQYEALIKEDNFYVIVLMKPNHVEPCHAKLMPALWSCTHYNYYKCLLLAVFLSI